MKKFLKYLLILITISISNIYTAYAKDQFTPEQIKQIQQIAREYLISNPDILVEANKKLQEQEAAKEANRFKQIKEDVVKNKDKIFTDQIDGRIASGNLTGDITLVEFTQYQCTHCKEVEPIIEKLLKENTRIKLITIYWPFFGDDAIYATKAILAAQKQDKFTELNQVLWKSKDFLTKNKVDDVIKAVPGINIKKLHSDMESKVILKSIDNNIKLATELKLMGTPTFAFYNSKTNKVSNVISGQTPAMWEDLNKALNEVK